AGEGRHARRGDRTVDGHERGLRARDLRGSDHGPRRLERVRGPRLLVSGRARYLSRPAPAGTGPEPGPDRPRPGPSWDRPDRNPDRNRDRTSRDRTGLGPSRARAGHTMTPGRPPRRRICDHGVMTSSPEESTPTAA